MTKKNSADPPDSSQKKAGKARAASVTVSERKALATKAAHERWQRHRSKIPRATHVGTWKLGSMSVTCAVLEDKRRIFSERSLSDAFGHVRSGTEYKRRRETPEGEQLPVMVSPVVAQFLSDEARVRLAKPVRYVNPDTPGIPARGIEADLLPDLCDAFLAARDAGLLQGEAAVRKARAADAMIRGLAKVGVTAIVDEVTGFQFERDRDELQRLLEKYVSAEYRRWSAKFPPSYYENIFRLKGKKLGGGRPQWLGHVTNNIIYSRILPGMREKLCEVNPTNEEGHRARKHHQHITSGEAEEHLDQHISNVILLMRASKDWDSFMELLDRALPKRKMEEVTTGEEEGEVA